MRTVGGAFLFLSRLIAVGLHFLFMIQVFVVAVARAAFVVAGLPRAFLAAFAGAWFAVLGLGVRRFFALVRFAGPMRLAPFVAAALLLSGALTMLLIVDSITGFLGFAF